MHYLGFVTSENGIHVYEITSTKHYGSQGRNFVPKDKIVKWLISKGIGKHWVMKEELPPEYPDLD